METSTRETLESIKRQLEALRYQRAVAIPPQRKYPVSNGFEAVRIRLVSGRDPGMMDEAERSRWLEEAVSGSVIERYIKAGTLRRIKLGKQRAFITEQEVRNLEATLAKGAVSGYTQPAKYRRNVPQGHLSRVSGKLRRSEPLDVRLALLARLTEIVLHLLHEPAFRRSPEGFR